ncbi:MAG: hypothetical protein JW846_09045, partial [Dehalococcoidia bacterium]|nr:hypothetical protein [Dehalococcoidia bacterium]
MDDLYYWVLRVWHALTSNKKVLVGMAAAVAVVVTVTTVFAAPALSEGESVESSGVASVAVPVVTSSEVPVGPIVEFTIGEVTDSGMLPSSPFYFLKEAGRSLEYAFTFDSVKKANLTLRFANEDALAIHELCLDDEYLDTAQQCIRYQDHFFTSLAWAVKAKKEGADVDALMTSLRNAHHTHRLILAETLTRLPKQFGEAAIGAVAFTSA